MDNGQINKTLKNLEAGYNRIALKFSDTRKFFWRDLEFIADYVDNGDKVLDFGCGNGRLLKIIKNKDEIDYKGVDISKKLIDLARRQYPEIQDNFSHISSQDSLPFPDNFFNKVIAVAVFHHFPVVYAQERAREIFRVTKPGGTIIITVWNLWQPKFRKYLWDKKVFWKKLWKKEECGGMGFRDILIPFKDNDGVVFDRYHRAYTKRELAKIFSQAGFLVTECHLANKKNIILVGVKK